MSKYTPIELGKIIYLAFYVSDFLSKHKPYIVNADNGSEELRELRSRVFDATGKDVDYIGIYAGISFLNNIGMLSITDHEGNAVNITDPNVKIIDCVLSLKY